MSSHIPVLLSEILNFLPCEENSHGNFLDLTAGGGGHFCAILNARANWLGECWDRDPEAKERLNIAINKNGLVNRAQFYARSFGQGPRDNHKKFDFILADLGVSSFQLDDRSRGMSLFSNAPVDFRMNPSEGVGFSEWLSQQNLTDLEFFLEEYGEEPRAKKLAAALKQWTNSEFQNTQTFAERIQKTLAYPPSSRTHPATRSFQALRIAINDELGELKKLLEWTPRFLKCGGVLAVISFHSVEDRLVKNSFRDLALKHEFDILTKKPLEASEEEISLNPRSRSAKLRLLRNRS